MKSSSITQLAAPKMNMSLGSPIINPSMDFSRNAYYFQIPRYPEKLGDYGI
jgi:hypothetical protein